MQQNPYQSTDKRNRRSILYFADIQGPEVIKKRSIQRNLSMAGNTKVFGVCSALKKFGHNVIVYSPGSVAERKGTFHRHFDEIILWNNGTSMRVLYGATIDNRYLRGIFTIIYSFLTLPKIVRKNKIDTIIVYNITFLTVAFSVISRIVGIKVFLQYEDSVKATRERHSLGWKKIYRIYEVIFRKICSGLIAPNFNLIHDIGIENSFCLPGILNDDLISFVLKHKRAPYNSDCPLKLIYVGSFDISKGIDRFIQAINNIEYPLEMVVCGKGPLEKTLLELSQRSRHNISFRGLVSREELIQLMMDADVGINPHRSDLHNGGSWPFKVIEYLGSCGTVFCSNIGRIPENLKENVFLYNGNEISEIITAFKQFLSKWPELNKGSRERSNWAIGTYSAHSVGKHLDQIITKP